MQNYGHIERGIESLSIFSSESHDICRRNPCMNSIITADSLFSSCFTSPCTSALFGDSIGMESCVDVLAEEDFHRLISPGPRAPQPPSLGRDRRSSSAELPPPIPSLARTENLQPRMPWVLRRHYTADGRLVLTEEKADRHEYFRADRSNGRLTLHLVSADAESRCHGCADESDGDDDDDGDGDCGEVEMDGGDLVAVRDKCLEVGRRSRCVDVGVAVPPAMRPVHS